MRDLNHEELEKVCSAFWEDKCENTTQKTTLYSSTNFIGIEFILTEIKFFCDKMKIKFEVYDQFLMGSSYGFEFDVVDENGLRLAHVVDTRRLHFSNICPFKTMGKNISQVFRRLHAERLDKMRKEAIEKDPIQKAMSKIPIDPKNNVVIRINATPPAHFWEEAHTRDKCYVYTPEPDVLFGRDILSEMRRKYLKGSPNESEMDLVEVDGPADADDGFSFDLVSVDKRVSLTNLKRREGEIYFKLSDHEFVWQEEYSIRQKKEQHQENYEDKLIDKISTKMWWLLRKIFDNTEPHHLPTGIRSIPGIFMFCFPISDTQILLNKMFGINGLSLPQLPGESSYGYKVRRRHLLDHLFVSMAAKRNIGSPKSYFGVRLPNEEATTFLDRVNNLGPVSITDKRKTHSENARLSITDSKTYTSVGTAGVFLR